MTKKCKFWKKCKLYNPESLVCKNGGMYYSDGERPAGCYREMEEKEKNKS